MGTFSYSLSYSSRASVSSGCRRADGDYGIPSHCFCGGVAIVHTSRTPTNPGRKFFTCLNSEDGGAHIWKWWDEAIMEEFTIIRFQIEEANDMVQNVRVFGGGKTHDDAEIANIKERLMENEAKRGKGYGKEFKCNFTKRGKGYGKEFKCVLGAGLIVFISIAILFFFK